jgi:hypothetical protein
MQTIALLSWKSSVSTRQLAEVASAINTQVERDVAPAWRVSASVAAFSDAQLASEASLQVFIADDVNGRSGVHYSPDDNATFALVQYTDDWRWPVAASHEILEFLIDPSLHRLIAGRRPDDPLEQVNFLVQACDPCQSLEYAYLLGDGHEIYGSDFCLPAYYGLGDSPAGPYSFRDNLTAPGTVANDGYLTWIDQHGQFFQLSATQGRTETIGPISAQDVFRRNRIRRNLRGMVDRSLMLNSRFSAYHPSRRAPPPPAAQDRRRVPRERSGTAQIERVVAELLQSPVTQLPPDEHARRARSPLGRR